MTAYVEPARARGSVVLADATVVDPATGEAAAHRDVVTENGRIVAVRAAEPSGRAPAAAPAPDGAGETRVDASGRFVVPGYTDSHVHVLGHPERAAASFALMLAHGITSYRQMSGSDELLAHRHRLPEVPGAPAALAVPGDLLTPLNAATADEARAAVRHQRTRGADFIKAGMASREGFFAAAEECRRLGIPLAGHLPADVTAQEAAEAGVACIEHLGPGLPLVAAAAEPPAPQPAAPAPAIPEQFKPLLAKPIAGLLEKVVTNPAAMTRAAAAEALAAADAAFDEGAAERLAGLLAEHGVWQCPTLIREATSQDPAAHSDDPRLRWIDPAERRRWERSRRRFERLGERTREILAGRLDAQKRLLNALADGGCRILAGTDANGAGWIIPGAALHDELALLEEAGLDPVDVLRSATSAPAEFLGKVRHGRVEEGFHADLVLLREDPRSGAAAMGSIEGVMRRGDYWSRHELDAVLERCEAEPAGW